MTLYHYVVVRTDLPLGVLAAQVVHAAGESSERVPTGTHAVVLGVPDEPSLAFVAERLMGADIPHKAVCEPDSPYHGALMALGIEPMVPHPTLRKVLRRLPLLKETKKS